MIRKYTDKEWNIRVYNYPPGYYKEYRARIKRMEQFKNLTSNK